MTDNEDWPITGVAIVADITKCPAGYMTVSRTYDNTEEADLWRDGLFGRRVTRYMCVQRSAPQPGKDVLVDVSIINDRDPLPAGFTALDYTHDTREKATKKKVICVRWMNASLTNSAISELIILPRSTRRPPNGYTLVGEVNNLMLCYKMANIKTQSPLGQTNSSKPTLDMSQLNSNLPYDLHPRRENAYTQGSAAGYQQPGGYHGTRVGPPQRTTSSLSATIVTPLTGVPWQLSSKITDLENLKNIHIPEIRYKTIMDIENQYNYQFDVERGVKANS